MGSFPYSRFIVDSSGGPLNGTVISGAALVVVTEDDGMLTDALAGPTNGGRAPDTFTVDVDGFTYTLTGGFAAGPFIYDFTATANGVTYFFSAHHNYDTGSSNIAGQNLFGLGDYYGIIGPTRVGTDADLDFFGAALTCFLPGTMIRTPDGNVAVEQLAIGQLVSLADGRSMPVRWIGRQTVAPLFANALDSAPIRIKAGALAENIPSRDLYTSGGHAMILDGNMVIAGALVNGSSIARAAFEEARITYFHVELEEHAVIFANDAATESYCDNIARDVFDNAAEYKAHYPHAAPIRQMDMPHVKSQRQLPADTRRRLAARAAALFGNVPKVA